MLFIWESGVLNRAFYPERPARSVPRASPRCAALPARGQGTREPAVAHSCSLSSADFIFPYFIFKGRKKPNPDAAAACVRFSFAGSNSPAQTRS